MTPSLREQVLREWQPWYAAPDAKSTPSLHQLVPGVIKRLGLEQRVSESQILSQWAQIVGPDIARHTQPVSLQRGILKISVEHPMYHHAYRPLKPQLLKKIHDRVGKTAVRDIVFRIG